MTQTDENGMIDRSETVSILRGVYRLARRLRVEPGRSEVSLSGLGLLATLRRRGPMPAVRLAEEEGLQAQSLTRLLSSLEQSGCIERQRSDTDRRVTMVSLTAHGRTVLSEAMQARVRWLEDAMATLSVAERSILLEAAPVMLRLAADETDDG